MSADPMEAIVDTIVILECHAYELGNFTEAPIANVTWTQNDVFIGVTQDNKINVTSDTPGEVNFTCTVIDDYGRNATANGTIEFFEDVVEGNLKPRRLFKDENKETVNDLSKQENFIFTYFNDDDIFPDS